MRGESGLSITPLGGCEEVGLNATLLSYGQKTLLIDCGVQLGVERSFGAEKKVPDVTPIFAQGRHLSGVVLTHGHEDHVGGLGWFLQQSLRFGLDSVPVYGTSWTLALARARLEGREGGTQKSDAHFHPTACGVVFRLGPFDIELIHVTHSIPESAAVFVKTPSGSVLHTGDFKLEQTPWGEPPTDVDRLKALGEQGVDLLLADSTNSEKPGHSGSESTVRAGLEEVMRSTPGRMVVTLFASHVHRLRVLLDLAQKGSRRVCFMGRALQEQAGFARAHGWLSFESGFLVEEKQLERLPRDKVLVLTTGTQGEPHSGLARLAEADSGPLALQREDRVVWSARTIPGNEMRVRRLRNRLSARGVLVTPRPEVLVHCSGHACQGEQETMLQWVRPRAFIPIHGDRTMLEAHARTARAAGLDETQVLVLGNGQSGYWSDGRLVRGPEVSLRPVVLDPDGFALGPQVLRMRRRIAFAGLVLCTIAVDHDGRLREPPVIGFRGFAGTPELKNGLSRCALEALDRSEGVGAQEAKVKGALGRFLRSRAPIVRPEIQVVVVRGQI